MLETRFGVRFLSFDFVQDFWQKIGESNLAQFFADFSNEDLIPHPESINSWSLHPNLAIFLLIFIKLSLLSLYFLLTLDLLSTTNLQYTQRGPRPRMTQISRSPKDPRASLGGPERWLGPLCVHCKLVVESRSRHAKKTVRTATI